MDTQFTVPWQGFHHVALVTPDLDATIQFYRDVLGMHVGDVNPGRDGGSRHCFIKPGETTAWGLHFFDYPDAKIETPPNILQGFTYLGGAFQHIGFALPDESVALALHKRLQERNVQMTGINDLGAIRNFLFLDNHGILLEAAWSKAAGS